MSVHVSAYVWEHSAHKGTALLLMLAIADIAHKNGVAFPSVATLARFIRMSERNTQRVIAALESSGELEIKRNGGPHGTHLYRVKMNMTLPLFDGGDNLSPDKLSGDTQAKKGVTKQLTRGDAAVAPEPKEPRTEPGKSAAARRTRLPKDFKIRERVRKWYAGKGFPPALIEQHFEKFIRTVKANVSKYGEWDEALMNCIADDWGDVRRNWLRANPAAAAAPSADWWKSAEGVAAKAVELEVERGADNPAWVPAQNFAWFKARVCVAAGDGQWLHDKDSMFQHYLKLARERAGAHA